jgi:hypothetical protein
MVDDYWRVAGIMAKIDERLDKGVCIIAMQKPRGRDLGHGDEKSAEASRLYCSMSKGMVKIYDCKSWRGDNPNGKCRLFKIIQGAGILPTTPWVDEDEIKAYIEGTADNYFGKPKAWEKKNCKGNFRD